MFFTNPPTNVKRAILILNLAFLGEAAQAQAAVQAWVQRFNGPGNGSDQANEIAMDTNGNVFVAGDSWNGVNQDYVTIKYSSAGVPLWTNRYNGPANNGDVTKGIAMDKSGTVFVTGFSSGIESSVYATVAYSNAGLPLWTNHYPGPISDTDNRPTGIAADGFGNVVVTGGCEGKGGSGGFYATIKYTGSGLPLWTNRYGGSNYWSGTATGVAVDASGDVFVTGYTWGIGYDFATIKYSSGGEPLWTNRFNGLGNVNDYAAAIAVDDSGKVFVTGYSVSTNSWLYNFDYVTIAYSNDGSPLWTNWFTGPGEGWDQPVAIAVDGSGNAFVTGKSQRNSGGGGASYYSYATIKYSNAGLPLWTNLYKGSGNGSGATAMVVDRNGNVFVAGDTHEIDSNGDHATIAYSGAGVPLWTNLYNGLGNSNDRATAIAVDGIGNVFVTGYSTQGNIYGYDYCYATIKYSLTVPLTGKKAGNQLVLDWTNAAFGWTNLAFSLQSAPAITGTFTNIPGATSPYTNIISGAQQFFRLISN